MKGKLLVFPEALRVRAGELQDVAEAGKIREARKIWSERAQEGSHQDRITAGQNAMEGATSVLESIRGPKSKIEARDLFDEMSNIIREERKSQFAAYQRWAIATTEKAHARYKDREAAGAISDNEDAKAAFYETGFREIDSSLLSPEVAQYFQAIFTQLLAELNPTEAAALQRDIAFPTGPDYKKGKLEDF